MDNMIRIQNLFHDIRQRLKIIIRHCDAPVAHVVSGDGNLSGLLILLLSEERHPIYKFMVNISASREELAKLFSMTGLGAPGAFIIVADPFFSQFLHA